MKENGERVICNMFMKIVRDCGEKMEGIKRKMKEKEEG